MFVDCRVAKRDNCYPMIAPGAAHTDMLFGAGDMIDGGEEASTMV